MQPTGKWLAVFAAAVAAAPSPAAMEDGLGIDVRARRIVPGEVLRIDVVSPVPLRSVEGTFGKDSVYYAAGAGPTAPWSGWAVVGLDEGPGEAGIEVRAVTADGRRLAAERSVVVERKEFPVQRLRVDRKYVSPPPETQKRIAAERAMLARLYATRRAVPPPASPFVRPVAGEPTGVFGTRRFFNDEPRSPHPGLDLRAASGTPVKASGPGVVALSRDLYYSGNTIIIDHGGGFFTIYAHLSKLIAAEGDAVGRGERVGLSGATGRVTGPHLHWGAKIGDRPFDPRALLSTELFPAAPPLAAGGEPGASRPD